MKGVCFGILFIIPWVSHASIDVIDLYEVAQGNVALTSEVRWIKSQYIYTPYGIQKNLNAPVLLRAHTTGDYQQLFNHTRQALNLTHNQWGYTGQRVDASTGLMMLGELRNYAPGIGRFIQPDTYNSFSKDHINNPMVYVNGNPLSFVDPSGHVLLGALGVIGNDLMTSFTPNFGLRTLLMAAATIEPETLPADEGVLAVERYFFDPYSESGFQALVVSRGVGPGGEATVVDSAVQEGNQMVNSATQFENQTQDVSVGGNPVSRQDRFAQATVRMENTSTITKRVVNGVGTQTEEANATTDFGVQTVGAKFLQQSTQTDALEADGAGFETAGSPVNPKEYQRVRDALVNVQRRLNEKREYSYIEAFNCLNPDKKEALRPLLVQAESHRTAIETWIQNKEGTLQEGQSLLDQGNELLNQFPGGQRASWLPSFKLW